MASNGRRPESIEMQQQTQEQHHRNVQHEPAVDPEIGSHHTSSSRASVHSGTVGSLGSGIHRPFQPLFDEEDFEKLRTKDVVDLDALRLTVRNGWSVNSPLPEHMILLRAIVQDQPHIVARFTSDNDPRKLRRDLIPFEATTPNGDILVSNGASVGHLLALFGSVKMLDGLEERRLLCRPLFYRRCDFELELHSGLQESSMEIPCKLYRNVPCSFMTTIRDNKLTLLWLMNKGYIRHNVNELDSTGRNLLHCCVDEETPQILQELLTNRKIVRRYCLREMLRTREGVTQRTPFMYALKRHDPHVLMLFLGMCTEEFITEAEDLSGVGRSIFNCILGEDFDPSLSVQTIREILKRGAIPDQHVTDKIACIETAIANEEFCGGDLKNLIQLLLKYGAKATSGALFKLVRLPFRTDEEILQISKLLLRKGKANVLLANNNNNGTLNKSLKDIGRFESYEDNSLVAEIFRQTRIDVPTMKKLFDYVFQYVDESSFSLMVSNSSAIARAIFERVSFDIVDEKQLDLESIIDLLQRILYSKHTQIDATDIFYRVLNGFLRFLFVTIDYRKAKKFQDKVMYYIKFCLDTMEQLKFNFNSKVEGQVALFSLFHANVPDEMVPKVLQILPSSFDRNITNSQFENLATLTIKRFNNKFSEILNIFNLLRAMEFDFKATVHSNGETLLMVYVRKCGEAFDQMQTEDSLTTYIEEDFFKVMRFLMELGVEDTQAFTQEHLSAPSILSEAMHFKHCTIAEEILKVNPEILNSVSEDIVLNFIKNCPEVLEFLNGRLGYLQEDGKMTVDGSIADCGFEHSHVNKSHRHVKLESKLSPRVEGSGEEESVEKFKNIRATWLNYVQHHHRAFIKLAKEEPEKDYTKEVELIYDYLVHTQKFSRIGMRKFSRIRKRDVKKIALEFSVFRKPEYDYKKNSRECVNADLLMQIVDTSLETSSDASLVTHPLFTEYFEKFYRTSFFNSLLFIFLHLIFLILLNGCITSVVTPVTNYAMYSPIYTSGHHLCHISNCTIQTLSPKQRRLVRFSTDRTDNCTTNISNPQCVECLAYTANHSLCSKTGINDHLHCPFTVHVRDLWLFPGLYILLGMSAFGIIRELIQFLLNPRDYLSDYFQNIVEVSMVVFSFLFAMNFTKCPMESGYKHLWQFQLGAIAVINSWILMFLYMSKFPAFATYVIMFTRAVRSGLSLLVAFSWLLLGFAFEFHLLLGNQLMYRRVYTSLSRVWIMMIGEIDYKDVMTNQYENTSDPTAQVHFEVLIRVMLLIFVLVINIILMNLFIGLVVGDVEKINKEAQKTRWRWNLKFTESIDYLRNFLEACESRLQRCCSGKKHIPIANSLDEEIRATNFVFSRDPKKIVTKESTKAGLHVTTLEWHNIFKWKPVAIFFGFVPAHELIARLVLLESRKNKLFDKYWKYQGKRYTAVYEPVITKHVNFPVFVTPWPLIEDNSDAASEVSIHDDDLLQQRILFTPGFQTSESIEGPPLHDEPLRIGFFLTRQDRPHPVNVDTASGGEEGGQSYQRYPVMVTQASSHYPPPPHSQPESGLLSPMPPSASASATGTSDDEVVDSAQRSGPSTVKNKKKRKKKYSIHSSSSSKTKGRRASKSHVLVNQDAGNTMNFPSHLASVSFPMIDDPPEEDPDMRMSKSDRPSVPEIHDYPGVLDKRSSIPRFPVSRDLTGLSSRVYPPPASRAPEPTLSQHPEPTIPSTQSSRWGHPQRQMSNEDTLQRWPYQRYGSRWPHPYYSAQQHYPRRGRLSEQFSGASSVPRRPYVKRVINKPGGPQRFHMDAS